MIILLNSCIVSLLVITSGTSSRGGDELPDSPLAILRQAVAAADDDPEKDHLLGSIAAALARGGQVDEALRLADADRGDGYKDSIFRAVAIAQARSGDFAGALSTARRRRAPEVRQAIKIIAVQQAWSGDAAGARRTIEDEFKGGPESDSALGLIARAQERKGDYSGAAQTYGLMPGRLEKALACRPAALARLKEGDIAGALRAAEEARRLAADYLANLPPRERQARVFPREIEPDSFRDGILREIVLEQAKAGNISGARKTAESITMHIPLALAVAREAAIRARSGDRVTAAALIEWGFEVAQEAGYRGQELIDLATAQALVGEAEEARRTFIKALRPAFMDQSIVPAAQARAGDPEGAMQTLVAIEDPGARRKALRYLPRDLVRAGDVRRAVSIAEDLPTADDRALALREVSESQAARGDRAGALATVRHAMAIDAPLAGETLRAIARAAAELGDVRGALGWVADRCPRQTKSRALLGVAEGILPKVGGPIMPF